MSDEQATPTPIAAKRKQYPRLPIAERKARKAVDLPKLGEEWLRLRQETKPAYEAFCVYYQTPKAERSINKTAEKIGKHRTQLTTWSSMFSWIVRARAWDDKLENEQARAQQHAIALEQDTQKQQQREAQDDSLKAARALKREALRVLAAEQAKAKVGPNGKTAGDPDAKNIALAGQALEKASQMERIALGLPTDISRTDITLRETVAAALESQRLLRDLITEDLCDACRSAIRAKMVRLAERDRELVTRLA